MLFRVTHVADDGTVRARELWAPSNALAIAFMEQLYGMARGFVVLRLGGRP